MLNSDAHKLVLLVTILGYVIARLGLKPLNNLSQEAHELSPKNLSQRLLLSELPTELSNLGASFNGALDRLEFAYQQLEAFNADVTHELRTPLANLIGQTQVALSRQRSSEQLVEVLQSNRREVVGSFTVSGYGKMASVLPVLKQSQRALHVVLATL